VSAAPARHRGVKLSDVTIDPRFLATAGRDAHHLPRHARRDRRKATAAHATLRSARRASRPARDDRCRHRLALRLEGLDVDAIVVTHAHADHAGGLAQGAPCARSPETTTPAR
jgi:glyoxylase-like metal-dependent hydrolase (beta-lactamase superfamily II)